MKCFNFVLSFVLVLSLGSVSAQSYSDIANQKTGNNSLEPSPMVGLWEVTEVTVGDETLTPTAKWFKFLPDGTLSSGNGWLQNFSGSYNYDQDTKELLQANQGKADEYGAFKVSLNNNGMTWQRVEDGQAVQVTLKRATKKPLAPWDKIVGRWSIEKAEGLDPETGVVKSEYSMRPGAYFFRWDREYRKFDENNQRTEMGIWHIHSHSPTLSIMAEGGKQDVKWEISFKDDQMIWTQKGDPETMKVYLKKQH
ncbi:hypothetical protein [Roseivirga sp. E12]|uniref:hypothetical protein n=1 Tax=Roseivirga sp. E12 TaxID=2819237 RepID=UPI001ABCFC93|nr:hypothetical protein [Roseivirga sp. E12]MBO3699193.1 hypothetical protein [Roseivirga sp. E12]